MTWYNSLSRAFRTASIPKTYIRDRAEEEGKKLFSKICCDSTFETKTFFLLSYREDLHNVVGGGPDGIYDLLAEDPHEAHAVCLEDPLLQGLELAVLCDDDLLLIVSLGQVHVHLEEKSVTFDLSPQAGVSFCY